MDDYQVVAVIAAILGTSNHVCGELNTTAPLVERAADILEKAKAELVQRQAVCSPLR